MRSSDAFLRFDRIGSIVVAIAILVFGVAPSIGFLERATHAKVGDTLKIKGQVDPKRLHALVETERNAWTPAPTPRLLSDLASAHMIIAVLAGSQTKEGSKHIDVAENLLTRSLSKGPANGFAWARLAQVEIIRSDDLTRAKSALQMSIETAEFEPAIISERLRLAFAVHAEWDRSFRDMVSKQVSYLEPGARSEIAILADLFEEGRVVNSVETQ